MTVKMVKKCFCEIKDPGVIYNFFYVLLKHKQIKTYKNDTKNGSLNRRSSYYATKKIYIHDLSEKYEGRYHTSETVYLKMP